MIINSINTSFKGTNIVNQPLHPLNIVQTNPASQSCDVYTDSVKPQTSGVKSALSKSQNNIMCALSPKAFINKYSNINFIGQAIQNNPRITEILNSNGLPVTIWGDNIKSSIASHFIPTSKYANMIMKNCGETFNKHDYSVMKQASLLHDVGKILIPPDILNKKDKLTDEQYSKIKLHEELGYEILRTSGLDPDVIKIVGGHHNYKKQPNRSRLSQILSVADIYSALKENRPYRKSVCDKEAFEVLERYAKEGRFDIKYVETLKECISKD